MFFRFRAKLQKRVRSVAFQSILRKRIRKLPKFLKILKIIQFYSILFNRVLTQVPAHVPAERAEAGRGRSRAARQAVRARGAGACHNKTSKFCKFWRARSRLDQNEILQVNMRLTAFFKLYKMCTLLHRSKLNILAKRRFKNQQFS